MDKNYMQYVDKVLNLIQDNKTISIGMKYFYILFAIINLLIPLFILIEILDQGLGGYPATTIIGTILIFLVVVLIGFAGFKLFWQRQKKIRDYLESKSKYIVSFAFSDIVLSFGHWLAMIVGIGIPLIYFIVLLLVDSEALSFLNIFLPLPIKWTSIIWLVAFGFIILIFFTFISERIKIFPEIGINITKEK